MHNLEFNRRRIRGDLSFEEPTVSIIDMIIAVQDPHDVEAQRKIVHALQFNQSLVAEMISHIQKKNNRARRRTGRGTIFL